MNIEAGQVYRYYNGELAYIVGISKHSVQPPISGVELLCKARAIGGNAPGIIWVQIFTMDGQLQHYNQYFPHDLVLYSMPWFWVRSIESFLEPLPDGGARFELVGFS